MHNLLINSKSFIINGNYLCTGEVKFSDNIPEGIVFDKKISAEMRITGSLFAIGNTTIVMPQPLSYYDDHITTKEQDIIFNIASNFFINNDLRNDYEKNDMHIKSENIYILINKFEVGNDIVSNYIWNMPNKRIYLKKMLEVIKTKRNKKNTNIK